MSKGSVLSDMLGITHPILQAGMGYVARAESCTVVSEAGALGVIGAASLSPEQLRAEIRKVRERTDRPFGVDFLFATVGRPSGDDASVRFTEGLSGHSQRHNVRVGRTSAWEDRELQDQILPFPRQFGVISASSPSGWAKIRTSPGGVRGRSTWGRSPRASLPH